MQDVLPIQTATSHVRNAGALANPVINPLGYAGCVPTALSWGQALAAAGTDSKVVLYDGNGTVQQQFNYASDDVSFSRLQRSSERHTSCFLLNHWVSESTIVSV